MRTIDEDPYEYDNPLHNTIVILWETLTANMQSKKKPYELSQLRPNIKKTYRIDKLNE